MKKWILENMGRKPIVVVAVVLMMYFIYSERDKRTQIRNLNEVIAKKDQIIMQQNVREQQLADRLLDYALKIDRYDDKSKKTDSLLRSQTEDKVNKLLK